jgi:farnesyl-diphosphate farnesyltransferase
MAYAANKLLTGLLKDVSRTFYRTLRILPGSIRPQISLAYLLARTTDTIADTELVAVDRRLAALENLRRRILGRNTEPLIFAELVDGQSESAEKALLENAEPALAMLETLSNDDRQLVRQVIETITSGQELDLRRFAEVSPGKDTAMRMAGATLERQPKQVIALKTDLNWTTTRIAWRVA